MQTSSAQFATKKRGASPGSSKVHYFKKLLLCSSACRLYPSVARCATFSATRLMSVDIALAICSAVYRERNGQPSWEEWQANTLAAELLMPTFLVNAEIKRAALCLPNGILYKSASDPNYEKILEMAARMGVSWSAIRIRLQQMQIINGKPIHCHPLDVIRFGE